MIFICAPHLGHCSELCELLEAVLFMKLLDEFFDLGDAALENEITIVWLTFGDLAGAGVSIKSFTFPRSVVWPRAQASLT